LNFATFSNDSLAILILWFCPEFGWWDMIMYYVFCTFISRPTSLLASERISVFSFMVFVLSPNKLSLAWTNSWCVLFNSKKIRICETVMLVVVLYGNEARGFTWGTDINFECLKDKCLGK
jgi:hypothetical protein